MDMIQVLLANMTDRELMNVQTRNMMNIMYHGPMLAEMEDIQKRNVMIFVGYHDVYPDIPGFIECWADIPCAFCDGYENRDRIWGIVVNSKMELEKLPKMAQNWTSKMHYEVHQEKRYHNQRS